MKFFLRFLTLNLIALVFAAAAIVLALHSREGWGWFLFAAVCTSVVVENKGAPDK